MPEVLHDLGLVILIDELDDGRVRGYLLPERTVIQELLPQILECLIDLNEFLLLLLVGILIQHDELPLVLFQQPIGLL